MSLTVSEKVNLALDAAYNSALFHARQAISRGDGPEDLTEGEFKDSLDALHKVIAEHPLIRPDVWSYCMFTIHTAIQSLNLEGKICNEPLESSPTKSSDSTSE